MGDWRPVISTRSDPPRFGVIIEQSCETELDMIDLFLSTLFYTRHITQFKNVIYKGGVIWEKITGIPLNNMHTDLWYEAERSDIILVILYYYYLLFIN